MGRGVGKGERVPRGEGGKEERSTPDPATGYVHEEQYLLKYLEFKVGEFMYC